MRFDETTRRSWLKSAAVIAAQMNSVSRAETGSDPLGWTLNEAAAALARRVLSSEELNKLCGGRIRHRGRLLHSFITPPSDSALRLARGVVQQAKDGSR